MSNAFPYAISEHEIYRYLGYRGQIPDQVVLERIHVCLRQLQEQVHPQAIWKYYDIQWIDTASFNVEGSVIHSRQLSKNINGCKEICLFAATLGPEPDRLIQKAEISAISDAVLFQAISAAMIESYCNAMNQRIREEMSAQGKYLRPRFSPGYGDFALDYQGMIGQFLQMSKTIGITLTDSLLMMPSKSVTAVIGISEENNQCTMEGCEVCNRSDSCLYQRIK